MKSIREDKQKVAATSQDAAAAAPENNIELGLTRLQDKVVPNSMCFCVENAFTTHICLPTKRISEI